MLPHQQRRDSFKNSTNRCLMSCCLSPSLSASLPLSCCVSRVYLSALLALALPLCFCLCPCQQRFSPEPETQLGILTRLLAFGLAFCVAPQCIAHVNLMELLMPRTEYSSFFSFFCANFIFIFSAFLFFALKSFFFVAIYKKEMQRGRTRRRNHLKRRLCIIYNKRPAKCVAPLTAEQLVSYAYIIW